MNARLQKFYKKSFHALSSQNHTWKGVSSAEEDAPERRGFWDGVDLRLGAIEQTNARKRESERDNKKSTNNSSIKEYKEMKVCMHENA